MKTLLKIKLSTRALFASLLCVLTFVQLNAAVVEIDGVNYSNEGNGLADGEAIISGINHGSIPAEVVIPEKVTINGVEYTVARIHREAFAYNSTITSVTLPAGLKYIDNYAFSQCSNLAEIKGFPEKLDYVGHATFNNTKWLSDLKDTAPQGLYLVGGWVLGHVGEMPETLIFPENTIGICDVFALRIAYTSYYNVKKVVLNEGLKYINYDAFEYFIGLTEVNLPASLEVIESEAFDCCFNIERFTVADGNANFSATEGVLYNKDKTKLILYPCGKADTNVVVNENVTEIEEYAFYGAQYIKSLTIPEGITSIPSQAIRQMSSLETVILPSTVNYFGFGIFVQCNKLKDIVLYAEETPEYWGEDLSLLTETTLYVPEASIDAYKAHEYWGKMLNIKSTGVYVGIENIVIDNETIDECIYNLNGQRIITPQKGQLYIKGKTKYIQR